jgi:hypothetical protein
MSSTKPFETAAVLMRPFALAALDHALPCRMRRADRVTQPSGIDLDPDTRQVTPVGIPARLHRRWPVPESVCVVDTGMDQLIHLLVAPPSSTPTAVSALIRIGHALRNCHYSRLSWVSMVGFLMLQGGQGAAHHPMQDQRHEADRCVRAIRSGRR